MERVTVDIPRNSRVEGNELVTTKGLGVSVSETDIDQNYSTENIANVTTNWNLGGALSGAGGGGIGSLGLAFIGLGLLGLIGVGIASTVRRKRAKKGKK